MAQSDTLAFQPKLLECYCFNKSKMTIAKASKSEGQAGQYNNDRER